MRDLRIAFLSTLCLFLLTAVLYPALLLGVGVILPVQAQGSLLNAQGAYTQDPAQAVGSALIGQPFQEERFFWSRPSMIAYSTADPQVDEAGVLRTGLSGASNLAPSNPVLLQRVQMDLQRLEQGGVTQPTADLVYSSGSGLDPHISPIAAAAQVERVAVARNLSPSELVPLVAEYTEHRFLGLWGEPGVNVLRLNLALEERFPLS